MRGRKASSEMQVIWRGAGGREQPEHTDTSRVTSRRAHGKGEVKQGFGRREKRRLEAIKRVYSASLPDETNPRGKQCPKGVNVRREHL